VISQHQVYGVLRVAVGGILMLLAIVLSINNVRLSHEVGCQRDYAQAVTEAFRTRDIANDNARSTSKVAWTNLRDLMTTLANDEPDGGIPLTDAQRISKRANDRVAINKFNASLDTYINALSASQSAVHSNPLPVNQCITQVRKAD
jgi:hypothetical protein